MFIRCVCAVVRAFSTRRIVADPTKGEWVLTPFSWLAIENVSAGLLTHRLTRTPSQLD